MTAEAETSEIDATGNQIETFSGIVKGVLKTDSCSPGENTVCSSMPVAPVSEAPPGLPRGFSQLSLTARVNFNSERSAPSYQAPCRVSLNSIHMLKFPKELGVLMYW